MIADTSTAAGSRDEVADKPAKPNHTAAVILGAISLVVAIPTAVVNILYWTGHLRVEVPDMLNMQLTAVAVGCFIGAAAAWWGANVVHRLAHVEAVEHRIEAREVILRDELNERLDGMELRFLHAMDTLGRQIGEAVEQAGWQGVATSLRETGTTGMSAPLADVLQMPRRNGQV